MRGPEGGLGIDVDKSNVIIGSKGQTDLRMGDRVVAIDGVRLGSQFVSQALEPGKASYVFSVERGAGGAQVCTLLLIKSRLTDNSAQPSRLCRFSAPFPLPLSPIPTPSLWRDVHLSL